MPYNVETVLVSFGGALPGGEVWNCGLRMDTAGLDGSQVALQTAAQACVSPVTTMFTALKTAGFVPASETLNRVWLYRYAPNATSASGVARATVTSVAGTGSSTMPNQCAVVCSLRTVNPGRTGRGRIYLPHLAGSLTNSQLSLSQAAVYSGAVATMCQSLNGITGLGSVLGGTSGFVVTNVVVDSVIDTQRRRRNKVVADQTSTTAVP